MRVENKKKYRKINIFVSASPRSTRSSSISNPSASHTTAGRINDFRKRSVSMEQKQLQLIHTPGSRKISTEYTRKDLSPPPSLHPQNGRKLSSPAPLGGCFINPTDIQRFASMELVEEDPIGDPEPPPPSELMGFFDHCAKLIMHLVSPQLKNKNSV